MTAFEYGWGTSNDPSEKFWVRFHPVSHDAMNWKEEVYAAARAVANTTTKPLLLFFSGGVDSEVMCRAFFDQGINFSVLTVEYPESLNAHDIKFAKIWCAQRAVRQEIVHLDIRDFFKNAIDAYGRDDYVTGNIFRYLQIKLLELAQERGAYGVLGGWEQLYVVDEGNFEPSVEDVYLDCDVGYAVPLEWCRRNKKEHQPYFYFSTPELLLSYLRIPLVDHALNHPKMFRNRTSRFTFKCLNYQTEWLDIKPRKKFNGFEKVKAEKKAADERLKQKFTPFLQSYRLYIPEMLKQLSAKK
jgi:hypothetical protein